MPRKEHDFKPKDIITHRWNNLPAAGLRYKGHIAYIASAAGIADGAYICLKTVADTFAWYGISSGSTPTITTPMYFQDFCGTVLNPDFTVTLNGAGSVAMLVGATSVANGVVTLNDTGVAGANDAQISMGTNRFVSPALFPTYETRAAVTPIAGANGLRARAILWNVGGYGAVGDWIGFEFSAAASANWRAKSTVAGAAVTNIDTLVPVVAGAYYIFKLIFLPAGGALGLINNTIVATYTAAQTPVVQLEPLWYVDDGGLGAGAACIMNLDYIGVWQNRI